MVKPRYRFPAFLDTGLNDFFAMREDQFINWSGCGRDMQPRLPAPSEYRVLKNALVRSKENASGFQFRQAYQIPVLPFRVWIFRNLPGKNEADPEKAVPLDVDGVTVYPSEVGSAPVTPTLGLATLEANRLRLVVAGRRSRVSLSRGLVWPFS